MIKHEKRGIIIFPHSRVHQIILLVFFLAVFIIISGKLIHFCLAFVAVVLVQLIPSSMHSCSWAIIAPWQMVNWGAERSFSATVLCTGTASKVTCLRRPEHVWEGNPSAQSVLAVKKSCVRVWHEPCSPLWGMSLSPQSSRMPSPEGEYLNILFAKKPPQATEKQKRKRGQNKQNNIFF